MEELIINNIKTECLDNETILEAANRIGIDIPTLCYNKDLSPLSSCMICSVRDVKKNMFIPACSAKAYPGMVIDTESEEVLDVRRTALELLMKEHIGDCLGPCTMGCPVKTDIPAMIREIRKGNQYKAFQIIKEKIPFPSIIGRLCDGPCEKVCRREKIDTPVPIRMIIKNTGDTCVSEKSIMEKVSCSQTGQIAVIGSGLTGLATGYYLARTGYSSVIFEKEISPGGRLHQYIKSKVLTQEMVNKEIESLKTMGVQIRVQEPIGNRNDLDRLASEYSVIIITMGDVDKKTVDEFGLSWSGKGIEVDPRTCETGKKGVFAGGNAIKAVNTVKSLSHAYIISNAVHQFLTGIPVTGLPYQFNSHIGRLKQGEADHFLQTIPTVAAEKNSTAEPNACFSRIQNDAGKCLDCDCVKKDTCTLRSVCTTYMINQKKYKGKERAGFIRYNDHPFLLFEPGKCIKCGNCVQVAKRYNEEFGFTFIGKGFGMTIAVPFDKLLSEGIKKTARECIRVCPTGALGERNGK